MSETRFDKKDFLMSHIRYQSDHIEYNVSTLLQLTATAREVFQDEPMLLELNAPVHIVGDIHGQYKDLHQIFAAIGLPDRKNYLFLGDYIDRGDRQLETICCLLAWKINYPKKLRMIRGNHETRNINGIYGFSSDLNSRFDSEEAPILWSAFNEMFDYMPISALINKKILCMHGGVGPTLNNLDQIRSIQRPLSDVNRIPVAQDLLWADPCLDLTGFSRNLLRGVSYFFGTDVVKKLCEQLKLDLIVRAHQLMNNGYGFFCGRKLVTIFSAPNYYGPGTNMAGVINVTKELVVSFTLFNPTTDLQNGEAEYRERYKNNEATGWGYVSKASVERNQDPTNSMTKMPGC